MNYNKIYKIMVLLIMLVMIPNLSQAAVLDFVSQDTAGIKWMTGTYFNSGATVLQNENGTKEFYGKFGLVPMFEKGPYELALDLTLYFNHEGEFRTDNWDQVSDYIRKILFFRYNKPEDPFSFRLEMVDDLSFGNGVIMRHYANSIRYPLLDNKLGGSFMWNSGYDDMGIIFIDDVADPHMFGARGFIQPHDNLVIGATALTDTKINTRFGEKDVTVMGLDLSIPFETKTDIACKVYGEYVNILDRGDGGHTGLSVDFGGLSVKTEYKRFSTDYISNYFDHLYEMERSYKASYLYSQTPGGRASGWFNEIKLKLNEEFKVRASYEKDYLAGRHPHLSFGVDFEETTFNKVKISFDYDRKNLYYSAQNRKDAIYQFKAAYDVNGYTHILYNYKYILDESGNPANSINLETRVRF